MITFLYAFGFLLGMIIAATILAGLLILWHLWKERRAARFSLNPDWDGTRDFIDALPTKVKREK